MKTTKNEVDGKERNSRTASSGEILESLLRRHDAKAQRYAYKLAGNSEEAKELVQEASYRLLRRWESYEAVKSFQSWYLTIVKNLFNDAKKHFRNARTVSLECPTENQPQLTYADILAEGGAGILQSLERAETIGMVRNAFECLSENHRSVLELCDIEGRRYADIARSLGIPSGTVRSRIFRARRALRSRLPEMAQIN